MKLIRHRKRCLSLEALEPRCVLSGYQPTAAEQLLLEQLNDARASPAAYGAAIGLNLGNVAASQPLAWDARIVQAARLHSQDMNDRHYFDHNTPEGVDPAARLTSVGVSWISWGESQGAGTAYPTSASALQALIVDPGITDLGHRKHLLALDPVFKTQNVVGIGIVQGGNGPLVNYYTIDTAALTDGRPILTGAVFSDNQGNGRYDIGEGLAHVHITVSNASGSYTTTTFDSGGYSIPLSPGTYTVTINGGGLTADVVRTVTLSTTNVRVNFALAANAVQAQASAWVGLLYRDLLGRIPQTAEINAWVNVLRGGAARDAVVRGFLGSTEYTRRLVGQWYQQYLHRMADSAGLTGFGNALGGASEDAVRSMILASQEYFVVHGSTATSFVTGLYQELLGRTPVGHEADSWINQSSAGRRTAVVGGLLGSQEFKTRELKEFYISYLRRRADAGGLTTFAGMLTRGADERVVVFNLVASAEYYKVAPEVRWLQNLYQDVLGRSGDNLLEIGAWLAVLHRGTDRVTIAKAFQTSDEMERATVNALYQHLLGRAATADERATAVHQLDAEGRAAAVIVPLVASDEYSSRQGSTDPNFIRGLYTDLLGRNAGLAEIDYWVGFLNTGSTRSQVAQAIGESTEYLHLAANNLFTYYLNRLATPLELDGFLTAQRAGSSDAALAAAVLGSDEYYQA